jgi:hypothetical protein
MVSGLRVAASVADALTGHVSKVKLPFVAEREQKMKREESESETPIPGVPQQSLPPRVNYSLVPAGMSVVDYAKEHFVDEDDILEVTEDAMRDAFDVPIIVKEEIVRPIVERKPLPEPPKRPVASGFLLYRNDYYAEAKKKAIEMNPEATHQDHLKMLSKMWSELEAGKKKVPSLLVCRLLTARSTRTALWSSRSSTSATCSRGTSGKPTASSPRRRLRARRATLRRLAVSAER